MNRAIIIGAGLGGLSAACTLAARGYDVTVFEKNDRVGGKAGVWEQDGYRFDIGPSIVTTPGILKKLFAQAGEKLSDHLRFRHLDPQWRSFFPDRSVLDLSGDLAVMKKNLREFTRVPEDVENYERFLAECERLDKAMGDAFYWRPVGSVRDLLFRRKASRYTAIKGFLTTRPHQSFSECVETYLKDERTVQMFERFSWFAGSTPEESPAVMCGRIHQQIAGGVWHPDGGNEAIPNELRALAKRRGVEFVTGIRVVSIETEDGQVVGVKDDQGTIHRASSVISNMDAVRTHRELLRGAPLTKFEARREYEPACSALIFYLGLKEGYPQLLHHNFVHTKDPAKEADQIVRLGELPSDPSVYLLAPAVTDPSVAPKGGEALKVVVQVPYLRPHHNWEKLLPDYRKVIFDKLTRVAGLEGLESRLVVERAITPADIQAHCATLKGSLYGLASHNRAAGLFKPSNRSPDLDGLYLAGESAHPGAGMSMALMSGWIAADALDSDGRIEKRRSAVCSIVEGTDA